MITTEQKTFKFKTIQEMVAAQKKIKEIQTAKQYSHCPIEPIKFDWAQKTITMQYYIDFQAVEEYVKTLLEV